MSKGKSGKGREYVLIIVMFAVVFGCFAAAMTTLMPGGVRPRSPISAVSAFDIQLNDGYTFVETDRHNGIRYYIITKPQNGTDGSSVKEAAATTLPSSEDGSTIATVDASDVSLPETTVTAAPSETTTTTATTTTTQATTTWTTVATTAANDGSSDNRKVAYLTFDDGPSENTGKILDILDRYNVKATFFVIYHKNMESQYRAIVERGHTIACHSYTHSYRKIYKSEDAYFDDLTKIHDYIQEVTGVDSHIMRFPGGSSNTVSNKYCKGIMKSLKPHVLEHGYVYHDWNVDSTDASGNNRDPETLLANVKSGLTKRKCNILMHDTGRMKQTTVDALPSIIEYIRSQGYEMEAITDQSKVIRHG